MTVRLHNAALDDEDQSPAGIILRGGLDTTSLEAIRVDDSYQRDIQSYGSQTYIRDALDKGQRLPDIELGMRGQDHQSRGNEFILKDPVYVIDGLQRISTIIEWLLRNQGKSVNIGAVVHFNTTKAWERERFYKLNNWRKKLSQNVVLRNMRETNTAIATLYGLSFNEPKFALYERVAWEQNMRRQDLVTALTLTKLANRLHIHISTAATKTEGSLSYTERGSAKAEDVASSLKKRSDVIKLATLRYNMIEFADLLEDTWGVKNVQYKDKAHYLKGTFLHTLAKLFSDHKDFWQGDKLFVPASLRRKIKGFNINEPFIARLTGSGGRALEELYDKLLEHVNKGKRTHHLRSRYND